MNMTTEKPFPFFHPYSRRFHFVLLLMLLIFSMTWMRSNLAMTMTCMVNTTALTLQTSINSSQNMDLNSTEDFKIPNTCGGQGNDKDVGNLINDYGGTIVWNRQAQSLIFSGSFYGSLLVLLPAGYFADRTSPSNMMMISMIICIVCTVFFPYMAMNFGYQLVVASRVLIGFAEGMIAPAMNAMVTNWLPNHEKATAASIFTSGNQLAGVLGIPIAAAFCASTWKWPAVFYCASFLGLLWLVLWKLTMSNTPRKASMISLEEKEYLEKAIGMYKGQKKNFKTPWRHIFTSIPFICCILCGFSGMMVHILIQLYIPTFLKEVLFLKVMDNGIYSATPYVVQFVVKMIWSIFMDRIKGKYISHTNACKLSQGLSSLIIVTFMLLLGYIPDCRNPLTTVLIFCCMGAGFGIGINGFFVSLLTLAPPFTGILTSIQMMVGFTGMIVTPQLVSIFRVHGTLEEWRMIFFIISAFKIISGIIFVIFGQAEVQPWAKITPSSFVEDAQKSHNLPKGQDLKEDSLKKEQIEVLVKD